VPPDSEIVKAELDAPKDSTTIVETPISFAKLLVVFQRILTLKLELAPIPVASTVCCTQELSPSVDSMVSITVQSVLFVIIGLASVLYSTINSEPFKASKEARKETLKVSPSKIFSGLSVAKHHESQNLYRQYF